MTPFPQLSGIRDRVKQQIANDPLISINGLAESLGASQSSSRQWKSALVDKTLRQIEKSLGQLDRVAKYLGVTADELLFSEGLPDNPDLSLDTPSLSVQTPSLNDCIARLSAQDQRLIETLVWRLTEKKGDPK